MYTREFMSWYFLYGYGSLVYGVVLVFSLGFSKNHKSSTGNELHCSTVVYETFSLNLHTAQSVSPAHRTPLGELYEMVEPALHNLCVPWFKEAQYL